MVSVVSPDAGTDLGAIRARSAVRSRIVAIRCRGPPEEAYHAHPAIVFTARGVVVPRR